MKNIRKILILVIMVMATALSFTACGDPYKNLKLVLDDGGFESAFERSYEYKGEGADNTFSIEAMITGAGEKVSTDVVFTIQDKSLIEMGETTISGNITKQEFVLKSTGQTYITVSSKEGNLSENIAIESYANPTGIKFNNLNEKGETIAIPIIRGQKTSLNEVMSGYTAPLLNFEPAYATKTDVSILASVGADMVEIDNDNNTLTVTGASVTDFTLTVTSKQNSSLKATATVKVLDPISKDDFNLKYASRYVELGGGADITYSDLEKNVESDSDYILYLADQSAGDRERDTKSIYLYQDESAVSATAYTFTLNETKGVHTNIFSNTLNKASYVISNGDEVGNSDIYTFNVNYSGYEKFFTGIDLKVKVLISSFPSRVVVDNSSSLININNTEDFYVFNEYKGMFGTPFCVKVCNEGGVLTTQEAYVYIWDTSLGQDYATTGAFTIFDSAGKTILPGVTKVKSNQTLYIRFNPNIITSSDDYDGRFLIYAKSAIDSNISSLDETNKNGKLNLVKDYYLNELTDLTITLGENENRVTIPFKDTGIPFELYSISVGDKNLVKVGYGTDKSGNDITYFESIENKLGQTTFTVVSPNGYSSSKNLFVTKNLLADDVVIQLRVGSQTVGKGNTISITIDVNKSLDVVLLVDGVEYTEVPSGYNIAIDSSSEYPQCNMQGWRKIKTLSSPSTKTNTIVFTLSKTGESGSDTKSFTVNLTIVKPIKSIIVSNSYVSVLTNSIKDYKKTEYEIATDNGQFVVKYYDGSKDDYVSLTNLLGTEIKESIFTRDGKKNIVGITIADEYYTVSGNKFEIYTNNSKGYLQLDNDITLTYSLNPSNASIATIEVKEENEKKKKLDLDTAVFTTIVNGVEYKLNENSTIVDKTYVFSAGTSDTGSSSDLSFKWVASIDETSNKIVLKISGITNSTNNTTNSTNDIVSFDIRLDYIQKYTVSEQKTYNIAKDDNGYYIKESAETDAKKVYSIGGYVIDQNCFIEGAGVFYVKIGAIKYEVTDIEYDENNLITGGEFTYNQYANILSAVTSIKLEKCTTTTDLILSGINKEGDEYQISLNKNQIKVGDSFGFSYIVTPKSDLTRPGVTIASSASSGYTDIESISKQGSSGDSQDSSSNYQISAFNWKNSTLLGVKSSSSWEDVTGLSFTIDYSTNQVRFTILNMNKFVNYLGSDNVNTLTLVAVDSLNDDNTTYKTGIQFIIKLNTGTEGNPYLIYDAQSLQDINLDLNAYYKVTNDISLSGVKTWTPIGINSATSTCSPKISTADNKEFTISGFNGQITLTEATKTMYLGLFSILGSEAEIENIVFKNINFQVNLNNAYNQTQLYVGVIAGKIDGAKFTNVSFVDSDNVNYENYTNLNNISAGNFKCGVRINNIENAHTTGLTVYVGGFAGVVTQASNGKLGITSVSVSLDINDNVPEHAYYVGGFAGALLTGSVTTTNATLKGISVSSIIVSKNTNSKTESTSYIGGVVGDTCWNLSDLTVVTYIYTLGGNAGGVVGRYSALKTTQNGTTSEINNVSVTPWIYGASNSENIGGVVGHLNSNNTSYVQYVELKNIKVKLVERSCSNVNYNSNLTGANYVGGVVGYAEGYSIIDYASVFSYNNNDYGNNFYGDIVLTDYKEKQSITNAVELYAGGFVGYAENTRQVIEYAYFYGTLMSQDGASIGGAFGGLKTTINNDNTIAFYDIKDVTLSGYVYYHGNYSIEDKDTGKASTSAIGNFVGRIDNSINTSVSVTKPVDISNYSIIDSYSVIKAKDLDRTEELSYINNFVGDGGAYIKTIADGSNKVTNQYSYSEFITFTFKRNGNDLIVSYTISDEATKYFGISTDKKTGTKTETNWFADAYNESSGKIYDTGFGSQSDLQFGENGVAKSSNVTIILSDDTDDESELTATYYLRHYKYESMVFAINSFYMGFTTDVYKGKDSKIDNYTFNESDFKKCVGLDGDSYQTEGGFNYFDCWGYGYCPDDIEVINTLDLSLLGNVIKIDKAKYNTLSVISYASSYSGYKTTYIYKGEENAVFNDAEETLENYTKYQNRYLLDGNVVPVKSKLDKTKNPDLIVDVAPESLTITLNDYYKKTESFALIGGKINDVFDINKQGGLIEKIVAVPSVASTDVVFESSDSSIFTVSNNKLTIRGYGMATLRVYSSLNKACYSDITILTIDFVVGDLNWKLLDGNSETNEEYNLKDNNGNYIVECVAKYGLTLTSLLSGTTDASLNFKTEYVVDLSSVSIDTASSGTDKLKLLQGLTIGGQKLDVTDSTSLSGTKTIVCDGLQHSIFGSVLGSVIINQKIYFEVTVNGETIKCYIGSSSDGKPLKFVFSEGVFDITGSDEFSFLVVDRENFIIALDCDSNKFDLSLNVKFGGDEITIGNIEEGVAIDFEEYGFGHLIIRLDSAEFNKASNLKTFRFTAYVDSVGQQLVNVDENYTLEFVPRLGSVASEDLSHSVMVTLVQQQVETINIIHYTNMLYQNNDVPVNSDSYKYPSDIIIPGFTSLLQIDFYPSFGFYDYIEIISSSDLITMGQVVEVVNGGKNEAFSWYEQYEDKVVQLSNGIRISNRYSTRDLLKTPSAQYEYNGTMYIALSADAKLSAGTVGISIIGYESGVATPLFSQVATLSVEAWPGISVSASANEITFGGKVSLDISLQNANDGFSVSLRSRSSDAELIGSLGNVTFDQMIKSYVLTIYDNKYVYTNYTDLMYQDLVLTFSVSKTINGYLAVQDKEIDIRLVPYIIDGIHIELNGASADGTNYIVSYYQTYDIAVKLDCSYSQGYYDYLLLNNPSNSILSQINEFESYIAQNTAQYNIFSQGVQDSRNTILTSYRHIYTGEFVMEFDSVNSSTTIRFTGYSVSNFIWAEIGIEYTERGIGLVLASYLPKILLNCSVSFTIDFSSEDDNPEPITSVQGLMNMGEGSYILLKDLYLVNWSPIDVNFKSFDGNGYVITILSFASFESDGDSTNIGLFKSIPENTVVKNVTIELLPYAGGKNFTDESYADGTYATNLSQELFDKLKSAGAAALFDKNNIDIDIKTLSNVNFGVLAGENNGMITNVEIVNDASQLRSKREGILSGKTDSNKIDITYGDSFEGVISEISNKYKATNNPVPNRTVKVTTIEGAETTVKGDNIGLLVGSNNGYITNCSASGINLESQEYTGGLVGYNSVAGKISSSFFKGGNIIHTGNVQANTGVGGLVARNAGSVAYSYVQASGSGENKEDYPSSGIMMQSNFIQTFSFAGGFVYENTGTISNCYSNIRMVGVSGGFAYLNEESTSVIEYCYSLSAIKLQDDNYYPFAKKSKNGLETFTDCFYLYNSGFANMDKDGGESLQSNNFSQYSSFVGYAFNADYNKNEQVENAVWFIPTGNTQDIFKTGTDMSLNVPQLVSANLSTLSIRYMVQNRNSSEAYTYNYATSKGSSSDPILIDSAETFNKSIVDGNETRNYRFISDITFTRGDEVSTTAGTNFKGKIDGNNMTIKSLRLTADSISTTDGVTKLGLFSSIQGRIVDNKMDYAVVKNLNIEIAQIDGMNVNLVGVLAGEISNATISNISVSGEGITVQGQNAVGGVAGLVYGDTDLVNITSTVSVTANYYSQINPFDYTVAYTLQKENDFDSFVKKAQLYNPTTLPTSTFGSYGEDVVDNVKSVSYAGGIAGICIINKQNTDSTELDAETINLYNNLYRARRLYIKGTPVISGEVAGGIFGYLSANSNLSDCDITVEEGMQIKASRLAGGLVGHSMGEIKRCTIENSDQETIDSAINKNPDNYDNVKVDKYTGSNTLFGDKSTEFKAMFLGGLVGFMGAGSVKKSYNRVNVVSYNSLYAGGVVGLSLGGTTFEEVYTTASVQSYYAYGGFIGYLTDSVGGDKFFVDNVANANQITLNGVVLSNIWQYSHLDTTRKSTLSPNASPAKLGSIVGFAGGGLTDTSKLATMLAGSNAHNIAMRAEDRLYYKQTYTFKSITTSASTLDLVNDIGNILNKDIKVFEDSDNNIYSLDELYPNYSDYVKIQDESGNEIKPYIYSNGFMSALYSENYQNISTETKDTTYKNIILLSRLGNFGSARSLKEFVNRKSDDAIAKNFYAINNVAIDESKLKGYVTDKLWYNEDASGKGSYVTLTSANLTNPNIYSSGIWDEKSWSGTQVNETTGALVDPECVFPKLKNSVDTWSEVFVYTENDLKELNTRTTATFILMNDIYLSEDTGGFCTTRPFRGTIRSAKVGDVDGTNTVNHNYVFTIFNLNCTPKVSSSDSDNAVGGLISTALGATFENFNLHVNKLTVNDSAATGGKVSSLGILVGRATSEITIANVQILGSENEIDPIVTSKDKWKNTNLIIGANSKYALSAREYKKDGSSIFEGKATVIGQNIEFMGGYVGIGKDAQYSTSEGNIITQNGNVILCDYLNDRTHTNDYKIGFIVGFDSGDNKIMTTYTDGKMVSTNEFIGKTQVKNIKFVNNYVGTKTSATESVGVESYMGAYFGIATLNSASSELVSMNVSGCEFEYNLVLNDKLNNENIDKFDFDNTFIESGVFVGAVAGKLCSLGDVVVNSVSAVDNKITLSLEQDKNYAKDTIFAGVNAGAFGALDSVNVGESTAQSAFVVDKMTITYKKPTNAIDGNNITSSNGNPDNIGGAVGYLSASQIASSDIKDVTLTVEGERINTYQNLNIGGFVGYSTSDVKSVDMSNINIKIDAKRKQSNVGGLIGYLNGNASDIEISGLSIEITKNAGNTMYVGGVAGEVKGNISNTYVNGEIVTVKTNSKIGGVAGVLDGEITSTYANTNIKVTISCNDLLSSTPLYIGGVVGQMTTSTSKLSATTAYGDIKLYLSNTTATTFSVGNLVVGGLVGVGERNCTISGIFSGSIQAIGAEATDKSNIYTAMQSNASYTYSTAKALYVGGIIGGCQSGSSWSSIKTNIFPDAYYNSDTVMLFNKLGTPVTTSELLSDDFATKLSGYNHAGLYVPTEMKSHTVAEGEKGNPKDASKTITSADESILYSGSGSISPYLSNVTIISTSSNAIGIQSFTNCVIINVKLYITSGSALSNSFLSNSDYIFSASIDKDSIVLGAQFAGGNSITNNGLIAYSNMFGVNNSGLIAESGVGVGSSFSAEPTGTGTLRNVRTKGKLYDSTGTGTSYSNISTLSTISNIDMDNVFTFIDGNINLKALLKDNWQDAKVSGDYSWNEYVRDASEYKPAYDKDSNTYTVTTREQLAYMSNLVNASSSGNFKIVFESETEFDMSGKIFDGFKSFSGIFDGGGVVIKGLNISANGDVGFFSGVTSGSTIKRVYLKNATIFGSINGIEDQSTYTGGLIGYVMNAGETTTISKVALENMTIFNNSGKDDLGALVGGFNSTEYIISNAYVTAYQRQRTESDMMSFVGEHYSKSNVSYAYMVLLDSNGAISTASSYSDGFGISSTGTKFALNSVTYTNYQGASAKTNMPLFLFGVDWLINTDGTNLANNFGLPKICFETQYWIDFAAEPTISGKTITVSTAEQLAWIALKCGSYSGFSGYTINLANDIDLEGKVWSSIGATNTFKGTFNGNGKTISNMLTNEGYYAQNAKGAVSDYRYAGLFGQTSGATIKDFTLKDATIKITNAIYSLGAVVCNATTSTISGITVTGATIDAQVPYVGGIVGKAIADASRDSETVILGCEVDSTSKLKTTSTDVGGIVGLADMALIAEKEMMAVSGCSIKVMGCKFSGTIISNNDSEKYIGGIIGRNKNYSTIAQYSRVLVQDCQFDGVFENCNTSSTGLVCGNTGKLTMYVFETVLTLQDSTIDSSYDVPKYNIVAENNSNTTVENVFATYSSEKKVDGGALSTYVMKYNNIIGYYWNCTMTSKNYDTSASYSTAFLDFYFKSGASYVASNSLCTSSSTFNSALAIQKHGATIYDAVNGKSYTASKDLPVGWICMSVEESPYEVGIKTTSVTIDSVTKQNQVASYVAFRYSSNRRFNITYTDVTFDYVTYGTTRYAIGNYCFEYGGGKVTSASKDKPVNIEAWGLFVGGSNSDILMRGGLFGCVNNVEFTDLYVNIKYGHDLGTYSGGYYSGVIANYASFSTFNNCHVVGTASSTYQCTNGMTDVAISSRYFGGIVGYTYNCAIKNNSVKNLYILTYTETEYLGGIVGYFYTRDTTNNYIEKCTVDDVSISYCPRVAPTTAYMGGIVGNFVSDLEVSSYSLDSKTDTSAGAFGAYIASCSVNAGKTDKTFEIPKGISTKVYVGGIVGFAKDKDTSISYVDNAVSSHLVYMPVMIVGNENGTTIKNYISEGATGGIVGGAVGVRLGISGDFAYATSKTTETVEGSTLTIYRYPTRYTGSMLTLSDGKTKLQGDGTSETLSVGNENAGDVYGLNCVGGIIGHGSHIYQLVYNTVTSGNIVGQTYVGGIAGKIRQADRVVHTNTSYLSEMPNYVDTLGAEGKDSAYLNSLYTVTIQYNSVGNSKTYSKINNYEDENVLAFIAPASKNKTTTTNLAVANLLQMQYVGGLIGSYDNGYTNKIVSSTSSGSGSSRPSTGHSSGFTFDKIFSPKPNDVSALNAKYTNALRAAVDVTGLTYSKSTVDSNSVYVNVNGYNQVGGLFGRVEGNSTSFSSNEINGTVSGYDYVGGYIGYDNMEWSYDADSNSYAAGKSCNIFVYGHNAYGFAYSSSTSKAKTYYSTCATTNYAVNVHITGSQATVATVGNLYPGDGSYASNINGYYENSTGYGIGLNGDRSYYQYPAGDQRVAKVIMFTSDQIGNYSKAYFIVYKESNCATISAYYLIDFEWQTIQDNHAVSATNCDTGTTDTYKYNSSVSVVTERYSLSPGYYCKQYSSTKTIVTTPDGYSYVYIYGFINIVNNTVNKYTMLRFVKVKWTGLSNGVYSTDLNFYSKSDSGNYWGFKVYFDSADSKLYYDIYLSMELQKEKAESYKIGAALNTIDYSSTDRNLYGDSTNYIKDGFSSFNTSGYTISSGSFGKKFSCAVSDGTSKMYTFTFAFAIGEDRYYIADSTLNAGTVLPRQQNMIRMYGSNLQITYYKSSAVGSDTKKNTYPKK